jgi:aminoglycoside phosphotransferase (APT) family kinase protein
MTREEQALIAELGRRYRLWSPNDRPTLLARGSENTTFAVGEYIVRRSGDLEAVNREVELLDALARATSVRVPSPALHEPELGMFAYRRLPGTPALARRTRDPRKIVPALVEALSAFRSVLPATRLPEDRHPNEQWHSDAVHSFSSIRPHLSAAQARLVEAFLELPPPSTRPVVVPQHNDLGAEHILLDDEGAVAGILDWTDAALADPARDTGLLFRDFGPDVAAAVHEGIAGPLTGDELRRIRFHARCKWLEDVAFGLESPRLRRPYLDNAEAGFDHTFASAAP